MTTISRIATASILAVGLLSIASPALATTTSEALKLCRKNPSCHSRVGEYSIVMTINGQEAVECPKLSTGQCIVVRTVPVQHQLDAIDNGLSFARE